MTRRYAQISWGVALIVGAVVLAWRGSVPWALVAAGMVTVMAGVYQGVGAEVKASTSHL